MNDSVQYVGDGVYVERGRFTGDLILTTHNGYGETNRIVLEPAVWANLLAVLAAEEEGTP